MKKQDIVPGDFYRILFGETPPNFLVEVLIRTLIMYLALLVAVRLMGKRMGGQLTISELAVMITLGAIVSPGMQMPQTGLLLCTMILICALVFQRGTNWLEGRSSKFEKISQGKVSTLVEDGVLQLSQLKQHKVSRQQAFAVLRNKRIYNLGQVERLYLEACGLFSVYARTEPAAGLLLFPPSDQSVNTFGQRPVDGLVACANCGKTLGRADHPHTCPVCGADQWGQASIATTGSNEAAS
nr:YetF domain-containing protein [uncultured Dyadobacter sp.]